MLDGLTCDYFYLDGHLALRNRMNAIIIIG